MDEDSEIQRAQEAANQNDFAAARAILRDVLIQNPSNASAWVALARVTEKREDSEMCLKQAAKLDPLNVESQRLLAGMQPAPSSETGSQAFFRDDDLDYNRNDSQGVSVADVQPAQSADPAVEPPAAMLSPVQQSQTNPLSTAATGSQDFSWSVHPDATKANKTTASSRGSRLETILLVILICVACVTFTALGIVFLPRLPFIASLIRSEPNPINNEVTDQIYANIDASNAEDIYAYMAAIHSQSPLYDQTMSMLSPMFSQYDLSFELTHVEVLEQNENEAKVAFVLVTRKLRGPEFQDNQVAGVMIMRPEGGIWKIYNQEVESIDYLK